MPRGGAIIFGDLISIILTIRRDRFDDPAWLFNLKLDGFRGLADTIGGWMRSKKATG